MCALRLADSLSYFEKSFAIIFLLTLFYLNMTYYISNFGTIKSIKKKLFQSYNELKEIEKMSENK